MEPRDVGSMTVGHVMRPCVRTLHRNDHLTVADDLMKAARIRHLPVVGEQAPFTPASE